MDGAFLIYLPKDSDLAPFKFEIPLFEWQGVAYPQGKPECIFSKNFKLQFVDNFEFIENKLPFHYQKMKWQGIEISGEGLDIFISSKFELEIEEEGKAFNDLINIFLRGRSKWIVVLDHQHDGFNFVRNGTIEDVYTEFNNSINNLNKGFMIYH
jgi:hypothetical protein